MLLFFFSIFVVYFSNFFQTDKASILDEAIEYLKSLQMQVQVWNNCFIYLNSHNPNGINYWYQLRLSNLPQIMWMTTGMAPMMFPRAHQFMPLMTVGMNSACMPAAQGLNQMPRVPYMNHSLPNHIPMNSSPFINPLNVANQMQNIKLREASNHYLHPDDGQTAAPQVHTNHSMRAPMFSILV